MEEESQWMKDFKAKYNDEHVAELKAVYNKYHGLNGNRGGFTSFVSDKREMELLVEANEFINADKAEVTPHHSLDLTKDVPTPIDGWMVKTHGYQAW